MVGSPGMVVVDATVYREDGTVVMYLPRQEVTPPQAVRLLLDLVAAGQGDGGLARSVRRQLEKLGAIA